MRYAIGIDLGGTHIKAASVFGMVARQFDNVFPTARPSDRQRYDHLHLARQIMARHRFAFGVGSDAVFDERRGVILNAYTGGSDNLRKSFDEAPKHRDAQYNEICQRELDYERGDDFLQIGQFTIGVARRYFMRSAKTFCAAMSPLPNSKPASGSFAATATCSSAPMMAIVSM